MRAYLLKSRATVIWVALVTLTILSLEFLQGLTFDGKYRLGSLAVIVVAFTKVRIVGLEYMELRAAPLPLRALFEAWILLVMLAIILISQHGTASS